MQTHKGNQVPEPMFNRRLSWCVSMILRLFITTTLLFFSLPGNSQHLPSTAHSSRIIERIKPLVKKEMAGLGLSYGNQIFIRIFKEEEILEIWVRENNGFKLFKSYEICSYGNSQMGPKIQEGDRKAPEGFYFVAPSQLYPYSNFHLAFNIGYPNQYDRFHGLTGSAIMVHGSCFSAGCFAMTDKHIEEIYTLVSAALKNGQAFIRLHIFPFRMTDENLMRHAGSEWIPFWENLSAGYRAFELLGNNPPNVRVVEGRYVFDK